MCMYISSSFSSLYTELMIILILSLPFYYLPLPSLSFSFYPSSTSTPTLSSGTSPGSSTRVSTDGEGPA